MASRYTYSELFYSFQGEGRFIGVPSIFFRTFGCNFSCHGFGQDPENMIPVDEMPYMKFDLTDAKSLDDVPVCDVGCDSAGSWQERYRHLAQTGSVSDVANIIASHGKAYNNGNHHHNAPHLVFTGGEPLLKGLQGLHAELLQDPVLGHINSVTFETNGTQPLVHDNFKYLPDNREYNFSVSPKLSNSGERFEEAINPEALRTYTTFLLSHPWQQGSGKLWLKFVVREEKQIEEIYRALDVYDKSDVWWDEVYLMPEGGTLEGLEETTELVANLALKNGFSYSPRAHVDVFGNRWGT